MFTLPWEAKRNREFIEGRVRQALSDNSVKVDSLVYQDNFALEQLIDVYIEKNGDAQQPNIVARALLEMISYKKPQTTPYIKAVVEMNQILKGVEIGPFNTKDLNDMILKIQDDIDHGYRVVIIPHSRGNFFYKNIYQGLDSIQGTCVSGIGLAPPLSSTYGSYEWITNANDRVINGIRSLYPDTLSSNIFIPLLTHSELNGDRLGHGIRETYLSYGESQNAFSSHLLAAVASLQTDCEYRDIRQCNDSIEEEIRASRSKSYFIDMGANSRSGTVVISFNNTTDTRYRGINILSDGDLLKKFEGFESDSSYSFNYNPSIHSRYIEVEVESNNYFHTSMRVSGSCPGSPPTPPPPPPEEDIRVSWTLYASCRSYYGRCSVELKGSSDFGGGTIEDADTGDVAEINLRGSFEIDQNAVLMQRCVGLEVRYQQSHLSNRFTGYINIAGGTVNLRNYQLACMVFNVDDGSIERVYYRDI